MKIILGTDICETKRIKAAVEKHGEKFLSKIFTENEIKYCSKTKNPFGSYAARFAAKEAASKALGTGINGLGWNKGIDFTEAELIRSTDGQIELKLYDKAAKKALELNIRNWAVSVSHSENYATATVIGYE